MKNIHILPTDKPSRLIYNDANQLCYHSNKSFKNDRKWMHRKKFNIYITSDEEIKEGDWFINFDLLGRLDTIYDPIHKCLKVNNSIITSFEIQVQDEFTILKSFCKKIILTDNQDLIKDGIQAIDDEFLEWFVKNPSCEWVDVKKETYAEYKKNSYNDIYLYEIIIPKEEPKQESHICKYCNAETTQPDDECYAKPKQETLEEAAKSNAIYEAEKNPNPSKEHFKLALKRAVLRGAKWQQEISYSEEEVLEIIRQYALEEHLITSSKPDIWFEQFKKK
jgi:hypothetical protein